jgi:anti-sigma regulatory factor (Ser/Thr protein kinase)
VVEIAALPENLKQLRTVVKETLLESGVEMSVIDASLLSVGEAAMNIVKHGFDGGAAEGRIKLEIDSDDYELVFRLRDNAPSVAGNQFHPRELDDIRPGGLGIYFMRELMDSVEFLPTPLDQGNLLEMRKRIKPV